MKHNITYLLLLFLAFSCVKKPDPQAIIDQAIATHGGQLFESKKVAFDFRGRHYSTHRENAKTIYTRAYMDDSLGTVKDVLVNSADFKRYINDTLVNVTDEWKGKYANSINSVLYFAQLPYGLNDAAVIKTYLEEKYFGLIAYHKIKVTFQQEGGGEDFDDVFIYWINKESNTLDYLAYSYATDGGGTRFRQAVNRRTINGMIFQDYINFKAESKNEPIEAHDDYFLEGKLLELSRIENENVTVE